MKKLVKVVIFTSILMMLMINVIVSVILELRALLSHCSLNFEIEERTCLTKAVIDSVFKTLLERSGIPKEYLNYR